MANIYGIDNNLLNEMIRENEKVAVQCRNSYDVNLFHRAGRNPSQPCLSRDALMIALTYLPASEIGAREMIVEILEQCGPDEEYERLTDAADVWIKG